MRRLDIGVASYRNAEKLSATLKSIEAMSQTDWCCYIIHNPDTDEIPAAAQVAVRAAMRNPRFSFVAMPTNVGYAGAVNRLLQLASTPYIAYLDNDVEILTPGWDERFCSLLDRAPEVAQVFPGSGHYGFHNGAYDECLWNAGYAWAIRREAALKVVGFPHSECFMDTALGHHEEVDLMIRLRLAGYRMACDPGVNILHHESSTQSPESQKRIHMGVVRWMNKWNKYFCGDVLTYPNPDPDSGEGYDPRTLRYTDWPPNALYLERMTLALFPQWNDSPRQVSVPGSGVMDAVEILKPKGPYKGRAI